MPSVTESVHVPLIGNREDLTDPILAMRGVGRELWLAESGDMFIERLRAEDTAAPPSVPAARGHDDLFEEVWQRLGIFTGQEFRTRKNLVVTYEIEGDGVWFFREGVRVNRKLSRRQLEMGISRCPLRSTTEIKDLIDYPYLFAVLMDPRIRANAW